MLFRKLYNFLVNRGPVGCFLAGTFYITVLLARVLILTLIGLMAGVFLTGWTNDAGIIGFACAAGVIICFGISYSIDIAGPLGFLSWDALTEDPKERAEILEMQKRRDIEPDKYSELPHFGKMLRKNQVMSMMEDYNFSPYVTKNAETLNNVAVSEDDKWICILGGYMPVDLVCGYNRERNEIYTIDGAIVKLPLKARFYYIASEIEAFFKDRGEYYTTMPRKAREKFEISFDRPVSVLDKADFSRLRYRWEKANANDKNMYGRNNRTRGSKYRPIFDHDVLNEDIFKRVLSGNEIAKTANAIKEKKIQLSEYLDFKRYCNEFSVCNGVELLYNLRYPDNREGIDFLFKCISDVDEAYFGVAIDVLEEYPRSELCVEIEENAKHYLETGDVVALGGVMFFAREIDYEIKCLKEMEEARIEAERQARNSEEAAKEQLEKAVAIRKRAEALKPDTIPEFEFDEVSTFGSDKVQGFAYQEE